MQSREKALRIMSKRHWAVCRRFAFAAIVTLLAVTGAKAETIGLLMGKPDAFANLLRRSIESNAETRPGVTIRVEDRDADAERQLEILTDFLADRVDALIVQAVDGDEGAVMTKLASQAGIPLVFLKNPPINVDELPQGQVYVGSDETVSGTLQAAEVCRLLRGKGRVAVVMGELVHSAARTRTEDIDRVLAGQDCSAIEIVERQSANGSRDQAQKLVAEWLKAGADFDAVIANNDEMALGAIEGLKAGAAWTDGMIVAGIDATPDGLAAVRNGDMQVTVLQNAEGQGRAALDAALQLASGGSVPSKILIPVELVTSTNVDAYLVAK